MTQALFKNFPSTGVEAFFSDRSVDFTLPEGADDLSATQKKFLSQKLKLAPEKVFTIRQIHGNKILSVASADLPQRGPIPQADGVITNVPGIILSVRTADCLPIFLFDPKKKCIGLVHAGWRGSSQKIVIAAILAMQEKYATKSADLLVVLGPAIRKCCYEVGEEFKDIFSQGQGGEITKHKEKFYLDLALVNKHQLLGLGVKAINIFDSQECTFCNPQFFSYRRDKEKAGRHLSVFTLRDA